MKKLIKLENDFYIVDDSIAINRSDYVVHQNEVVYVVSEYDNDEISNLNIWLKNENDNYASCSDNCLKITHSTKQLNGVIKLDIKEIEEIICGYSIENLTSNYTVNYSHSLY